METLLIDLRYFFTLGFGIALSAAFAGVPHKRDYVAGLLAFFGVDLAAQSAIAVASSGITFVTLIYPFETHIPLVLFLVLWCRRSWTASTGAVLTSYLCCELPNVVEKLASFGTGGNLYISTIAYCISAIALYVLLRRFIAEPINEMLEYSKTSCLAFSAVPLAYYVWCYAAGVYTDWVVRNSYEAMLAVSGMFTSLFVVFAAVYSLEVKKRSETLASQQKTEIQLEQAGKELESLRRLQKLTAEYRHDTRHRLRMLSALADEGDIDGIREFISSASSDLDAVSPTRYSANENVNMVLSFYAQECRREKIELNIRAEVPSELPLSATETCALVGNALENAVNACKGINDAVIDVELIEHRGKMLFSVTNSCKKMVVLIDGMPRSKDKGHGFGCPSIKAIAENHHGQAVFDADDERFSLKVVIPMES